MKHTSDIDGRFFDELKNIAEGLGADPLHMLSVMYSESGCKANAHNPNGDASGLIQFMPATLQGLGWHNGHEAFRKLSPFDQLRWVAKYYAPHKGKLGSVAALYLCTFLPALLSHAAEPSYELSVKGGIRGWVYSANAAFDANGDGKILVSELGDAVKRNCVGMRYRELVARLTGEGVDLAPIVANPGSVASAQALLGVDVDGILGPKTRAAIMAFQEKAGLVIDGIYGPKTRAALEKSVSKPSKIEQEKSAHPEKPKA